MNISDLFERRGEGRLSLIDKLAVYREDPSVFVTFSNYEKLDINPNSEWDDPAGIYAYPVTELYENFEQKMVPFAGDRKFAYIFRSSGYMLELQQYDEDDLDADIQSMESAFLPSLLKSTGDDDYRTDPKKYWEYLIQSWFNRFSADAAEGFWEISERMARHIVLREPGREIKMIWNQLIRACNYDAVCDRGSGYISANEPAQGVFLDLTKIIPIERAINDLTSGASA